MKYPILKITLVAFLAISLIQCTKKKIEVPDDQSHSAIESIADFFKKNEVPTQKFIINAATGGKFKGSQGTEVIVPPNAFIKTSNNQSPAGNISIELREIYLKSDMLMSDKATAMGNNFLPLKSGGEIFLRAMDGNDALQLVPGKKIDLEMPAAANSIDSLMEPFVQNDSSAKFNWLQNPQDTITFSPNGYIYSMYQFRTPAADGTWCNSDNPSYFSGPQTTVEFIPTENINTYDINVFLIFNNVNTMIHVYPDDASLSKFIYNYAPLNASCTMVAIGAKDGKLYTSFVPITITNNSSFNFTLSQMSVDDFKEKLKKLN